MALTQHVLQQLSSAVLMLAYPCSVLQQRAYLMARQREREGRRGSPGARGSRSAYDGYESEDSLDSFIDDGDEDDWRSAMRQITGESCILGVEHDKSPVGGKWR